MNDVQERVLAAYEDVARMLDSNGIPYYAIFGTGIGTMRHGGFVPWDDDVDIAVWADDLPRIDALLESGLDASRYYYHVSSADTHSHVILKTEGADFEEELRSGEALFLDIFPIDRYPDGGARRRIANAMIWGNTASIWALDRVSSIAVHKALCWVPRAFKRMADAVAEDDSSSTVIYCTRFKRCVFPKSWYGEASMRPFETSEIPVPAGIDGILTSIYGDYMTEPPVEERRGAGGFPCSAWKDWVIQRSGRRPSARNPADTSWRDDAPPRSA